MYAAWLQFKPRRSSALILKQEIYAIAQHCFDRDRFVSTKFQCIFVVAGAIIHSFPTKSTTNRTNSSGFSSAI
jgi:hypothetical protein